MMTKDFADRTRARIIEARTALTHLRDVGKDAIRQLAKLDKQHQADRDRLYEKLGELGEDVVDKLPEEAADSDVERAYALQEEINDLSAEVEDVSFAGYSLEDLDSLFDAVAEVYKRLKAAEVQLSKMERLGAKLGV